jgi:CRP-like cAMP-binding protein
MVDNIKIKYLQSLKQCIDSYSPISKESWSLLENICTFKELKKAETLLYLGDVADEVYFIGKGLLRAYFSDIEGNIYNKNLFLENSFAGSTVSLLKNRPSEFCLEALEDTTLIVMPYKEYRVLIDEYIDLKDFYIAYLEQNWVIEKECIQVALVLEDATQRYLTYLKKYPNIENRVAQHHIASHLGITPTQLSRIRKSLK